jgi:hypothetical protein
MGELFAIHRPRGVRRVLLWVRLSHDVHRDPQQMAGRDDQARRRPVQLADREIGMG